MEMINNLYLFSCGVEDACSASMKPLDPFEADRFSESLGMLESLLVLGHQLSWW